MEAPELLTAQDEGELAVWRSGSGPDLLLVHGSISDRRVWDPIRTRLEERFTVHVLHRRGRQGSSPLRDGDLRREFADVAAAIAAAGAPPHVLGHSFGAVCALGAVQRGARVRSLLLYEPPALDPGVAEAGRILQGVLDTQGTEAGLRLFLSMGPGETPESIERLAASPLWPTMLSLIPTTPLELQALSDPSVLEVERLRSFAPPVLYLLGSESPPHFSVLGDALASVLTDFRTVELAGEGHFANVLAPEHFADEVLRFIAEQAARRVERRH